MRLRIKIGIMYGTFSSCQEAPTRQPDSVAGASLYAKTLSDSEALLTGGGNTTTKANAGQA